MIISYRGKFGNNIFQYVGAKLLAIFNNIELDETNYSLECEELLPRNPSFNLNCEDIEKKILDNKKHIIHSKTRFIIRRCSSYYKNWDIILKDGLVKIPKTHLTYVFDGFFHNTPIINMFEKEIRQMFCIKEYPENEINYEDIVIHIRIGDFIHNGHNSEVIDPSWYLAIINALKINKGFCGKVYIVCLKRDRETYKYYFNYFDKIEPIYVSGTMKEDFDFIRKFDKIIISNSTFAWWAAWVSRAHRIYTPENYGQMLNGQFHDFHGFFHDIQMYNIRGPEVSVSIKATLCDPANKKTYLCNLKDIE